MIGFSILMFGIAILFVVLGVLIYNGKTDLIHSYHQTKVQDKNAYGKAMGKAIAGIGIPLTAAGVIGLFTTSAWVTVVLIIGMVISFIPMFKAQNKYNGGMF